MIQSIMSTLDLMSPGPMPMVCVRLSSERSSIHPSTTSATFRSLSKRSYM